MTYRVVGYKISEHLLGTFNSLEFAEELMTDASEQGKYDFVNIVVDDDAQQPPRKITDDLTWKPADNNHVLAIYNEDCRSVTLDGSFNEAQLEKILDTLRSKKPHPKAIPLNDQSWIVPGPKQPTESEKFAAAWDNALVNTYCERVKCPVPEEVEFESFIGNLQKEISSNYKITTDAALKLDNLPAYPTQSQIDLAKYLVKEMPMAKDSELGKAVLDVLLRSLTATP